MGANQSLRILNTGFGGSDFPSKLFVEQLAIRAVMRPSMAVRADSSDMRRMIGATVTEPPDVMGLEIGVAIYRDERGGFQTASQTPAARANT